MKNWERIAMQRINGVPAETWRALVLAAQARESESGDTANWLGAPRDEGYNNN